MEKTFLVYCRHVSFVTKGGVWYYSLRLRRREEFWGGGGDHSKLGRENWGGGGHAKNFSDFRKTTAPPPPLPVKNEWSLKGRHAALEPVIFKFKFKSGHYKLRI